ncbi:uncharacterized protein LOC144656590 isoform X2 [Oculina patagonica]
MKFVVILCLIALMVSDANGKPKHDENHDKGSGSTASRDAKFPVHGGHYSLSYGPCSKVPNYACLRVDECPDDKPINWSGWLHCGSAHEKCCVPSGSRFPYALR